MQSAAKTKTRKQKLPAEAIADWVLKANPQFDFGRDQDGDAVTDIKFCMVSQHEWERIRALAFVVKSLANAYGIRA